jgi:threonine dehydrogenase-like Zn-dependent dehydrogenase
MDNRSTAGRDRAAGGTGKKTGGPGREDRDLLVLTEPLSVGFHAVDRGGITDADTVAVIGVGMIGLGAAARAALRGARVIAVDLDEEKLETARAMGAGSVINAARETLSEGLGRLCGPEGPDVLIEAVGSARTYRAAVEAAAFAGRVVCIGYAKEDVALPTRLFVQKELDIRGSRNAAGSDFRAVSAYLSRRELPLERIISRRVSLSEAGEALAYWENNRAAVTKIIVEVNPL